MAELCKRLKVKSLEAGKIYGLVGHYGSGKTEFMRKIIDFVGRPRA